MRSNSSFGRPLSGIVEETRVSIEVITSKQDKFGEKWTQQKYVEKWAQDVDFTPHLGTGYASRLRAQGSVL